MEVTMALFPKAFARLFRIIPTQEILGTDANDTLETNAPGDIVRGLGGDDILSSSFNHTALFGNAGDDTLKTDVTLIASDSTPVEGAIAQFGGADDDEMTSNLAVGGEQATGYVLARGG